MVRSRSIAGAILLSIITCGLFTLYWMYKIFEESRYISGDNEGSAGLDLLLTFITCGIYGYFAVYKASKRLYHAELQHGSPYASDESVLVVVMYFFLSLVSLALLQSKINKFAS